MTETIWQSIAETPWWIFAGSIYLLWLSILAAKPRLLTISNFVALSLSVVGMSAGYCLNMSELITTAHYVIWFGCLILGMGLGFLHYRLLNIKPAGTLNALAVPGNWLLILTLLAIAISKFYFDYLPTNVFETLFDPRYVILNTLLYGTLSGWFIGKLFYAISCLRYGMMAQNDRP